MSYHHYIPESEAKARNGCFKFLLTTFIVLLVLSIGYNQFDKIEFDILFIIGLIIIVLGVALSIQKTLRERKGYRTKSRIIKFQPDAKSIDVGKEPDLEYPIVKFLNEKGAMKSEQLENSYAVGKYNRGDELQVIIFGDKTFVDSGMSTRNIIITSLGVLVIIFDLVFMNLRSFKQEVEGFNPPLHLSKFIDHTLQ